MSNPYGGSIDVLPKLYFKITIMDYSGDGAQNKGFLKAGIRKVKFSRNYSLSLCKYWRIQVLLANNDENNYLEWLGQKNSNFYIVPQNGEGILKYYSEVSDLIAYL
jgi:hypothetical protein